MLREKLDVLRRNEVRQRVRGRRQIEQSAFFRFLDPFVRVVVAVENDALVRGVGVAQDCFDLGVEISGRFEPVGEAGEHVRDDGVYHDVRAGNREGRAGHTELELVSGEGDGRGAVAVYRVLAEIGNDVDARLHAFRLFRLVGDAAFDRVENRGQLGSDVDGDYRRRRFRRAEAQVVARGGGGHAEQVLMHVDRLYDRGDEEQELLVFIRLFAGIEEVDAGIGGERPVVVLAASVDSGEGFFVEKTCQPVFFRELLHYLHRQLIVIGGSVRGGVDRR